MLLRYCCTAGKYSEQCHYNARSQNCEKRPLASVMSVHPSARLSAWDNSAPTGLIFHEI